MKHPAETTTATGGLALVLGLVLGLDAETAAGIGVALSFLPAAITLLVNAGGIRGAVRKLWQGRS